MTASDDTSGGHVPPEAGSLFIPKAEDMFRWRSQLECGCVHEVVIHEWVDRKAREFPPDPEEPEHGLDPMTWAKIRHPEPHSSAFWTVKLSCGRYTDVVVLDTEWKPGDGPRPVPKKRLPEIRRDFDEYWTTEGTTGWPEEGPERDHVRKMLDLGWPRPEPETDCYACSRVKRFNGYQRIGWLMPRQRPTPPPLTERQLTEKQFATAITAVAHRLLRGRGAGPGAAHAPARRRGRPADAPAHARGIIHETT